MRNTDWRTLVFDDTSWGNAVFSGTVPRAGTLQAADFLFEVPSPILWQTAGPTTDAYFVTTVALSGTGPVWLRTAADGTSTITVNGQPLVVQPARIPLDALQNTTPKNAALTLGMYDITPFVHSGTNMIAVHVSVQPQRGSAATVAQTAGLAADIVLPASRLIIGSNLNWRAAVTMANDWTNHVPASWQPAVAVNASSFVTVPPFKVVASFTAQPDVPRGLLVVTLLTLVFLALTAAAIFLLRRRDGEQGTWEAAVEQVALAWVPSGVVLVALWIISFEPLIPRPFPFTWGWLALAIALFPVTLALLLLAPRLQGKIRLGSARFLRSAQPMAVSRWEIALLAGIVILGAAMATYQLGYESFWQDEATSLIAAQGILGNGVPHMLSGFVYPKAELYSYLLALVVAVFQFDPTATRMISVVEFLISLLATYGLGRELFGRRVGMLGAALLLFSPMALEWGREARMYQQAELGIIVTVWLFHRAMKSDARPRTIYLALGALVLTYLSHEEIFIILPALALVFLAIMRLNWMRNPHWWIAILGAATVLMVQLFIAQSTHPILLGTDHTQQPNITFGLQNADYYVRLLFAPQGLTRGRYTALAVTAFLGCVAIVRSVVVADHNLRYIAALFGISMATLATVLTITADRYVYPILPLLALLAATTVFWLANSVHRLARERFTAVAARGLYWSVAVALCVLVVVAQTAAIANFGLASSRALGLPYQHRYPDYAAAGAYINSHWQTGDIIVTVAPALEAAVYTHQPAYLLYADKSLYFFERDNHIEELATGATAILNQQDFATLLAQHHRIWLLAAVSYPCCPGAMQTQVQTNFALVFEGQTTFIYLRTG